MKKLHLVCNAHLDPIWLWEWEEGAAAALSTFQSAVDLANEFNYVFCHNEVTLYKWIQEYSPKLFNEIKSLVRAGKWHIAGGWYLQPDCNLPCGESFVRQIMEGRKYFLENFEVEPTTAINFDPFGHSRGLVQIIKKCGYDSYMCCRPSKSELGIEDDFIWEGYDGSTVKAVRVSSHYNSGLGFAKQKIEGVISTSTKDVDVVLWGVGNHGGGPSRKDLTDIKNMQKESKIQIVHSTPESYFSNWDSKDKKVLKEGINYCMPGCFTSMVKIKQLHRQLENELYMTEKMCSHASTITGFVYPFKKLQEATFDLLNSEFHDIIPGTGIKEVEEYGIRLMNHGSEILNRLRAKAFFALSSGEKKASLNEFPVLVYNPHPYKISHVVDVGFNLEDQNYEDTFTNIIAYQGKKKMRTQVIKEKSNLTLDWMKRIRFICELEPCSINRFDCKKEVLNRKPQLPRLVGNCYCFDNGNMKTVINAKNGLIDSVTVDGREYLKNGSMALDVYSDNEDPWAMNPSQLKALGSKLDGHFVLMSEKDGSIFSGLKSKVIPSVRIVESGDVYDEVEAVFSYNNSSARISYSLYRHTNEIDVNIDLFFAEKNKLVKLHIPTIVDGESSSQVAFGTQILEEQGQERIMHKWVKRQNNESGVAIINNGVYGVSCLDNSIDITLLRSPAYSGHPIRDREIVPQDRFTPRMDQGERNYSFKMLVGKADEINKQVELKSTVFNEKPFALAVFPAGLGEKAEQEFVVLSNNKITMCALKKNQNGEYIMRLFNNQANKETVTATICGDTISLDFGSYEVKTIIYDGKKIMESKNLEI